MSKELEGRVAIVTGAARNIGRSIAVELARAGAQIVVNAASSAQEAAETVKLIEDEGSRAVVHLANVADPAAVDALAQAAIDAYGRLDILVNNAAIRREADVAELDYGRWREVTSVILDGSFLCARASLPHLRRSDMASVVNIGGMSAHGGSRRRAHVIAAKAGVVGLTRALACDLAEDGVTVNCVVPGLIETARERLSEGAPEHHSRVRTLLGRRGRPEEVAGLVRFLCGPEARYITGQTMHVNGGAFLA
jgi:3-oxoacyl-[acyl-carrier protein] reductase